MRVNRSGFIAAVLLLLSAGTRPAFSGRDALPVLDLPQPGIDDTAAYRGYLTRFFRDAGGNSLQVVFNNNSGRVVNLLADASDESISFTARDASGAPAVLRWHSKGASVSVEGRARYLEYGLIAQSSSLDVGHFLLCSMRKERDFQYSGKDRAPFDAPPYVEPEISELIANIPLLPVAERSRELALLGSRDTSALSLRLTPSVSVSRQGRLWIVSVTQPTFDGKNRLWLRLSGDASASRVSAQGSRVKIRSTGSRQVAFTVRIGTDSPSLAPLTRRQLFRSEFLRYFSRLESESYASRSSSHRTGSGPGPFRLARIERGMRSVELLASREKLMAGLPNYATYFGRDMMMSVMMMESILLPSVEEDVITAVLKKLSVYGEVSHEEGLGGEAIRENAAEYNRRVARYLRRSSEGNPGGAEALLDTARSLIADLQRTRESYTMVDESFQLPVLVGRYAASSDVTSAEKKKFFAGEIGTETRLALIVKNLLLVYDLAAPFGARRDSLSLVSFPKLDGGGWRSGSWRDSGPGYAGGRFGMDVNVVWVPMALESARNLFVTLKGLGFTPSDIESLAPGIIGTALDRLAHDAASFDPLIAAWRNAGRFFTVHLRPEEVKNRIEAKLS